METAHTPTPDRAWSAYQANLLAHQHNPTDDTARACVQTCRSFCEAMAYSNAETQKQVAVLEANLAQTLTRHHGQEANPCTSAA